jgi:arginine/lysine/ornithine decarboxylase
MTTAYTKVMSDHEKTTRHYVENSVDTHHVMRSVHQTRRNFVIAYPPKEHRHNDVLYGTVKKWVVPV